MARMLFPPSVPKALQDLPPEQWPREKLAREGALALSNEELLAVLFGRGQAGKDVLVLAREVTRHLESLSEPPSFQGLCALHGIGPGKAYQVLAALELSRRFLTRRSRVRVRRPADALPFLGSLRGRKQECFLILTLDGGNQVS
jgi:DNA repair protein RadC